MRAKYVAVTALALLPTLAHASEMATHARGAEGS